LHLHHTAEDEVIWPALRPRLAHSPAALSVLDALEAEHQLIDPLLAAVDVQFAGTGGDRLADVIDALTSALTGHLATFPPPLRLLYRTLWKPRFDKTQRW
jgi:hemerythrin HHE cation binding domain-containing protein